MTSRRPCWRSKQRNGGHVGGVKYSFGDWTLFLCKFLLLFHYAKYGFWSHERTHSIIIVVVHVINECQWTNSLYMSILLILKLMSKHVNVAMRGWETNWVGLCCLEISTSIPLCRIKIYCILLIEGYWGHIIGTYFWQSTKAISMPRKWSTDPNEVLFWRLHQLPRCENKGTPDEGIGEKKPSLLRVFENYIFISLEN